MSSTDIDANGSMEFVAASSDTCRTVSIYARNAQGVHRRVFGTGLEALTGSVDLAWADLDGDGLDDALGVRNRRLIVAWNRSTPQAPSGKRYPISQQWIKDVTIAEVRSQSEAQSYRSACMFVRPLPFALSRQGTR
jgi:hypothetical protein